MSSQSSSSTPSTAKYDKFARTKQTHSKPSSSRPPSSKPTFSKQITSSMAPTSSLPPPYSIRPASSIRPTQSSIAASTIPVIIKRHHLEDALSLGEGSLASKLCHLEESIQIPSQVKSTSSIQIPGAFPASVLPSPQQLFKAQSSKPLASRQKPSLVKSTGSVPIPGAFPASVLPPPQQLSKAQSSRPLPSTPKSSQVKSSGLIRIPGAFPVSVLPSTPQLSEAQTSKPLPSTPKPSQVKSSAPITIPGAFPASVLPSRPRSQVKSSRPVKSPGSALPHSSHRPSSSIRGRPPTILELNAALLEYLSKSSGQIVWALLKSWATSWGFFKFDRGSAFEVLDLLIQDIEHAVAEQTRDFIGRTGILIEKEEILRILRMMKSAIVRKIQGHLGLK